MTQFGKLWKRPRFWQSSPPTLMPAPESSRVANRKFPLGRLVATPNALAHINADDALAALNRHRLGDWGDVGPEDWQSNEDALNGGFRLLSVYRTPSGVKLWIITEADRSVTTLLLPEDY
jgi:hypothetical protein